MPKNKKEKIIVVLGPTAAGKSNLAVYLAKNFNGEILSADSRQIYKGLDIASNKITTSEKQGIPHHLLDIAKPNQEYSLYNWQQDAFLKIKKILSNKPARPREHRSVAGLPSREGAGMAGGKLPIITGGTGLYICSILQNYDLDPKEPKLRPCPYDFIVFGLAPDRAKLYHQINQRVDRMLKDGLVAEVKKIYKKYPNKKLVSLSGIGYRQIIEYLDKKISLNEAIEKIKRDSRHYAKRQMTWFRRMERQGIKIHWNKNKSQIKKLLKNFLSK